MSQALTAVVCLLIGVGLNEWIRRSNRIEFYTAAIFQKRFAVYEELWRRIYGWRSAADKVAEDTTLTTAQRHDLISEAVLDICGFCDDNSLYLNEEVTFQCAALYMGVEDIQAEPNAAERKEMMLDFNEKYRQTLDIVRSEAGLKRMDKLFQKVTSAKVSSDLIQHFRDAQKEHRRRSLR